MMFASAQTLRSRIRQLAGETTVEIIGALFDEKFGVVREEVVRAGQSLLRDGDALLRVQLVDETLHIFRRRDLVGVAVNDETRRWTWSEEREVVSVRLRRDRDEAFDLGTTHQELHADPRAERIAGDPAGFRIRMQRLNPVECGSCIGELARAVIELALAASDA